jgi:hypothetical protein
MLEEVQQIRPKNKGGRPKGVKDKPDYYVRGPSLAIPFETLKARLIHWAETKTVEQIQKLVENPKLWKPLPMIDALCAKQLWRAWDGTGEDFNRVLDRMIGKPVQAITGEDGKPLLPPSDINEIARRTAFLLSMAISNPEKANAPVLEHQPASEGVTLGVTEKEINRNVIDNK